MSEEEAQYDHIPGKLKLQSAGAVVKKDKKSKKVANRPLHECLWPARSLTLQDKKKKAKKQHKRQREKEQEEEEMDQGGARAVPLEPVSLPAMTPTERKFLEQKRLREEERLKKVAQTITAAVVPSHPCLVSSPLPSGGQQEPS